MPTAPGGRHVVHVGIGGELPGIGKQVVHHAAFVGHPQAVLLQQRLELVRGDELVPLMGAARQPAQHVFGTDDGQGKAFERAVERGDDHQAGRLHHLGATAHEQRQVGHVLHHLHGEHDVEALGGVGNSLGGRAAIVDDHADVVGMSPGDLDIDGDRIGAQHGGAEPCERLRQNAAAAADIENAQILQAIEALGVAAKARAGLIADIGEADRIELVQDRHLAARVPPLRCQLGETRDLGGVDCRVLRRRHVLAASATPVI
jgi:hypothetical protein